MNVNGKVHEVGPIMQVSETFKKRELIVEVSENREYKEYIKFEANQDKTALFTGLKKGDEITVHFNLRGKPWTNKQGQTNYFNSLQAWKIEGPERTIQTPLPVDRNDLPF